MIECRQPVKAITNVENRILWQAQRPNAVNGILIQWVEGDGLVDSDAKRIGTKRSRFIAPNFGYIFSQTKIQARRRIPLQSFSKDSKYAADYDQWPGCDKLFPVSMKRCNRRKLDRKNAGIGWRFL